MASFGDVLVLIAALGIGFSYIPGKRLTEYGDAFQINLLRLFIGSAVLLPFFAFHQKGATVPLSWPLVGLLVLYIVTNFGLGYTLLQTGLSLLPAWTASALTQTLPLFTTFFALLLLHESITGLQVIGGAIILLGGFLAISTPRKAASPTGWDRPVLQRRASS
jgi:drug/metabolite transporter (DMT)-like permease